MKITSLQISNVLSFKYYPVVGNAEPLFFDENLNIVIGENGSGKSTALEVINFIFKRVIFKQYNFNEDLYSRRNTITAGDRKQIILSPNINTLNEFRLNANWDSEQEPQVIRIGIALDDIDRNNIQNLRQNIAQLNTSITSYSPHAAVQPTSNLNSYVIDIRIKRSDNNFSISFHNCAEDFGFQYLRDYNYYREAIRVYNLENEKSPIPDLYDSFALISGYRNYNTFQSSVSLKDQPAFVQMQEIKDQDYKRSLNNNDPAEPTVFGLVRLRIAQAHFNLIFQKYDEAECEAMANKLPFILDINKRLKLVKLECRVRLTENRTWQYSFEFFDLRRQKVLSDINSLSAGQKSIVHLVFEAYGRGVLKGGLVIIDEPEIHLHYQFQHEYLQVIRELNNEQNCQYILVTHSEALISSETINNVRRFSLNTQGHTEIKSPVLTTDQKVLIKILDNARSTYAFFAKKVILVEGETDRFFFKAIVQLKYPEMDQEIAVLLIAGKGEFPKWTSLFESFGLLVYRIADLDYAYQVCYPGQTNLSLKTQVAVNTFKAANPDWQTRIESEYPNKTYILKNGDLEHYLGIKKDLADVVKFCNNDLSTYLSDNTNPESLEIREIMRQITL